MKILLYTVSDLKPESLECVDLMLSRIDFDVDADFAVVTNEAGPAAHRTIFDGSRTTKYVGFLKYSPAIPRDYDRYIYLDSDILYLGRVSGLFDPRRDFTVVVERDFGEVRTSPWHNFAAGDPGATRGRACLNAGTFSVSREYIGMFDEITGLYGRHRSGDCTRNAILEQSLFNHSLYRTIGGDRLEERALDLSGITQLFAQRHEPSEGKRLYHFCGFELGMKKKLEYMRAYTRRIK